MKDTLWVYSVSKDFYRMTFVDGDREDAIGELRACEGCGFIAKARPIQLQVPISLEGIVEDTVILAGGEAPWGENSNAALYDLEAACAPYLAQIAELVREHIRKTDGDLYEEYDIEEILPEAPYAVQAIEGGVLVTFGDMPQHRSAPVSDFELELRHHPNVLIELGALEWLDWRWIEDFVRPLSEHTTVRVLSANERVKEEIQNKAPAVKWE